MFKGTRLQTLGGGKALAFIQELVLVGIAPTLPRTILRALLRGRSLWYL